MARSLPLNAFAQTQLAGLTTSVGAYLDMSNFQQNDWNGLAVLWQAWTAVPQEGGAVRYYGGTNYTFTVTLQEMVKAGVRIVASFNPAFNPPSSADLASITGLLATLQANGADVIATVWHEPHNGGLTAAQYVAAVAFYGPAMRQYFPFYSCFSGPDTVEANGYYPGDALVDGLAVDAYFTPAYNFASNDLTNMTAMADNHGKALAVWEFGSLRGPNFFVGDNHTFAATVGTWVQGSNCAVFHSTVLNPFGTQTGALGFSATAAGNMNVQSAAAASFGTQMQACSAGDEITVGAWVQAATVSRACAVGASFYTAAGAFISTLYSTDPSAAGPDVVGGWAPLTGKLTAPATAAWYAESVQAQGAAAGETHRACMCYAADSTSTGHTQAGATTWWQFVQSTMAGRLTAKKPNGDLILFNAGMPGNSNMDAIQYSNDYRVGLWLALRAALNGTFYTGTTAAYTGSGSASVGPTAQGEVWPAGYTVSVHASSNVSEAQCRIYCGPSASPAYFTDGTTWGSTGDSTTNTPELRTGQQVTAVWAGGDPSATAYLTVTGTKDI